MTIGDFTAFYSVLFDVYFFLGGFGSKTTLPKTNMAPKNRLLVKEIRLGNPVFFLKGPCWFSVCVSGIFCFFLMPEFKVESRCGAAGAAFGGIVHFEKLVGRRGRAVFGQELPQNHGVFLGLRVNVWSKMD